MFGHQQQQHFSGHNDNSFPQQGYTNGSMMNYQSNTHQPHDMNASSYNQYSGMQQGSHHNGGFFDQKTVNNTSGQEAQYNMAFQQAGTGMNQQAQATHVEAPHVEQPAATESVYTTYENLPNYGSNIDVSNIIGQMKGLFEDKSHWKVRFDAIDNLRILNKYYSKEMNEIVGVFWPYIIESFESQKSYIAKNILMFSSEVFMNAGQVRLQDDIISHLLPQVLSKSISEKNILKKEAEHGLLNLIANCCYDSTITTLCKCCFDKNPAICEVALCVLTKIVNQIGENLPSLNFESLQYLMITLGKTIDAAKKGNMKKLATGLCTEMYRRFGPENYKELVLQTLEGSHSDLVQYFAKAIEDKSKSRESGFHEFVKGQKKMARESSAFMGGALPQKLDEIHLGGNGVERQVLGVNHQYGMDHMANPMMQTQQQGYGQMPNQFNGNVNGGMFNGQQQYGLGFPQNY